MRHWAILLAVSVFAFRPLPAVAGEAPSSDSDLHRRYLFNTVQTTASNDWGYHFLPVGLLTQQRGITGFAFGPGRAEVAFCAPNEGASALWTVPTDLGNPVLVAHHYLNPARPRLVWTAPPGVTLRGPVWWAPNGSVIAVCACATSTRDLVAVDYEDGEATLVTRRAVVTDVAWAPSGKQLAYVAEEQEKRRLWLQRFPPAEPRLLGKDGLNLRWARDESALRWVERTSESAWTEWEWSARDGQLVNCGTRPPRHESAVWSPDRKWCATLERDSARGLNAVTIYPSSSTKGDIVPLSDLPVTRLLGWSSDSNLLLVQDDHGYPWAISVAPPKSEDELLIYKGGARGSSDFSFAQVLLWPLQGEAGPPSWSSAGEQLAYVVAGGGVADHVWSLAGVETCGEQLGLVSSEREYLRPNPEDRRTIEKACVMSNVKDIAMALSMYVFQWNELPTVASRDDLRRLLSPYLSSQDVFLMPYGQEEVPLQWLPRPDDTLRSLRERNQDPFGVPAFAVDLDYWPGYSIVGSLSGSAKLYKREALEWQLLKADEAGATQPAPQQ